jgi:hypothetical protein
VERCTAGATSPFPAIGREAGNGEPCGQSCSDRNIGWNPGEAGEAGAGGKPAMESSGAAWAAYAAWWATESVG